MSERARVLVVDDDTVVCKNCTRILNSAGYDTYSLQSSRIALERLKGEQFDLAVIDLKMPGYSGIELLKAVKEIRPETAVIIITGYSTIDTAVEAVKNGASDYIAKPFTPDELILRAGKALEHSRLARKTAALEHELRGKYSLGNLIGRDEKMQAVFEAIKKVAPSDSSVFITGESGTGKELAAKAVHYNSARKDRPFISLDCTSLAENLLESELFGHVKGAFTGASADKKGLFEAADSGTLFLDEIGNISPSIQAKLLRVLQEREVKPVGAVKTIKVDARIITATNKNIEEMIKTGTFREDLYYRINIVPLHLPPLRERKEDIPVLADFFLEKYCRERGKQPKVPDADAVLALQSYTWPGNVRELENVIERVVVMTDGDVINTEHLPINIRKNEIHKTSDIAKNANDLKKIKKIARNEAVINIEKIFVIEALKRNGWNISKAAKEVKMQRQNFQLLIKKYQIKP